MLDLKSKEVQAEMLRAVQEELGGGTQEREWFDEVFHLLVKIVDAYYLDWLDADLELGGVAASSLSPEDRILLALREAFSEVTGYNSTTEVEKVLAAEAKV